MCVEAAARCFAAANRVSMEPELRVSRSHLRGSPIGCSPAPSHTPIDLPSQELHHMRVSDLRAFGLLQRSCGILGILLLAFAAPVVRGDALERVGLEKLRATHERIEQLRRELK